MLRMADAEFLEYARRHHPVLHFDQRRGGVVLGRCAYRRCRRKRLDSQEMCRCLPIVFEQVCLFALFVNRRSEAVDNGRSCFVILGCQRQHIGIGMLGVRVLGEINRRIGDHGPGRASQAFFSIRVTLDQLVCRLDGQRQVFHYVQVVRSGTQYHRRLLVFDVGVGKAQ